MKTFAQKSREYYNKLAEGYNDSLEARYTMRFKRRTNNQLVGTHELFMPISSIDEVVYYFCVI